MIVSVNGWARDHGPTVLLSDKVGPDSAAPDGQSLAQKQIKVTPFDHLVFEDGKAIWTDISEVGFAGVILSGKTKKPVSLNGEYEVTVQIGADELLSLAVAATQNWPVSFLLKRIEAARKALAND